jgi:hypothetical protein
LVSVIHRGNALWIISSTYRRWAALVSGAHRGNSWWIIARFRGSWTCWHFQKTGWMSCTRLHLSLDVFMNILMLLPSFCGCSGCGGCLEVDVSVDSLQLYSAPGERPGKRSLKLTYRCCHHCYYFSRIFIEYFPSRRLHSKIPILIDVGHFTTLLRRYHLASMSLIFWYDGWVNI